MRLFIFLSSLCVTLAAPSWWQTQCPIFFAWEGAEIIEMLHLQPECSQFLQADVSTVWATTTQTPAPSTTVIPSTTVVTSTTVSPVTVYSSTTESATITDTFNGGTTTQSFTAPTAISISVVPASTVVTSTTTTSVPGPTLSPTTISSVVPGVAQIVSVPCSYSSFITTTLTSYGENQAGATTATSYVTTTEGVAPGYAKRSLAPRSPPAFPNGWTACANALVRDSCQIALGLKPGASAVTETLTYTLPVSTVRSTSTISQTSVLTSYSTTTLGTTSYTTSTDSVFSTLTINGGTTTPVSLTLTTSTSTSTSWSTVTITGSAQQSTITATSTSFAATSLLIPQSNTLQCFTVSPAATYTVYAAGGNGGSTGGPQGGGGSAAYVQAPMALSMPMQQYFVVTGEKGQDGSFTESLGGGGGGGTFVFDPTGQPLVVAGGGGGGAEGTANRGNGFGGAGGGGGSRVSGCGGGAGLTSDGAGGPYGGNSYYNVWAPSANHNGVSGGGYGGGGAGCTVATEIEPGIYDDTPNGGGGGGYSGGSSNAGGIPGFSGSSFVSGGAADATTGYSTSSSGEDYVVISIGG